VFRNVIGDCEPLFLALKRGFSRFRRGHSRGGHPLHLSDYSASGPLCSSRGPSTHAAQPCRSSPCPSDRSGCSPARPSHFARCFSCCSSFSGHEEILLIQMGQTTAASAMSLSSSEAHARWNCQFYQSGFPICARPQRRRLKERSEGVATWQNVREFSRSFAFCYRPSHTHCAVPSMPYRCKWGEQGEGELFGDELFRTLD